MLRTSAGLWPRSRAARDPSPLHDAQPMNEIARKLGNGLETLRHIAVKLATLTLGRVYVSRPAIELRRWLDGRTPPYRFSGRAALVAHVYYPELTGEIITCFLTLPDDSGLILTCPPDRAARVTEAAHSALRVAGADDRTLCIVTVENRGRDIAPFLHVLNSGMLRDYDAVLKLHTKRSPHLRDGDIRRKLLYTALAGTPRRTSAVLKMFESPTTGLVGWRMAWRSSSFFWMKNTARVKQLCHALHCAVPVQPSFFEGSMFWLRPSALKRLTELGLETGDFEAEAGQTDGTLHHAIERIFPLIAASNGFSTQDIRGRILIGAAPSESALQ